MVNATTLKQELSSHSNLIAPKPNPEFFRYYRTAFIDVISREWKVIVLTSAVIGIVYYLYESFRRKARFSLIAPHNFSSNPTLKKRSRLLQEMSPLIEKMDTPVKEAFYQIKKAIDAQFILQFLVTHQHYELHDTIAFLTDKIREISTQELSDRWKSVLLSLHRSSVACGNYIGNNEALIFDASYHLSRLEGKIVACKILELANYDDEILEQLYQMDFEGFLNDMIPCFETHIAENRCLIAQDQESGEILGVLIYEIQKDGYYITSLGRRAKAARLGIGQELLKRAIEKIKQEGGNVNTLSLPLFLEVRKSNILAIKCYEKLGFKKARDLPQFYSNTHYPEDGVFMVFDPPRNAV